MAPSEEPLRSTVRTVVVVAAAAAAVIAVLLTDTDTDTDADAAVDDGLERDETRRFADEMPDVVPTEEIQEIKFRASGLRILRRDGRWDAASRSNDIFPKDYERIAAIAETIGNPKILRRVPDADPNRPEYGLSEDGVEVQITTGDGATYRWVRGTQTPTGDGWYATTDRKVAVYIVEEMWGATLGATPSDTHRSSLPTIDADAIGMMRITIGMEDTAIVLRRITRRDPGYPPTAYMEMTKPYEGVYAVSTRRYRALVDALSEYPIEGFFDPSVENAVPLAAADAEVIVETTGVDGTETGYRFHTITSGRYAGRMAVVVTRTGTAVSAPPAFIEAIPPILSDTTPFEYVDPLIMIPPYNDVREVRIDAHGTFVLDLVGRSPMLNGIELTEERSKSLYRSLIDLRIDGELSPRPPHIGEPVVAITYTLQGHDRPLRIEALEYDDHFYAIRRNGAVDFVAAKTAVDAVVDAPASIDQ